MKNIKIFGLTDVGMVREKNEDSFAIFKTSDMDVAVVADGMGGHTGGQIASSTTVETIKNYFQKNGKKLKIKELIEDSLTLSNRKIREISASLPAGMSMGTTCTMAVIRGKFCYYGHIGDSKLYHITKDSINQISTDHTMLQRMLDSGALKAEEAENYAHKNIIYRSIGGSENFKIDSTEHFLFIEGEMLLLCSDGLSGLLTQEEMFEILKAKGNIKSAAEYMINLAKHRGGDDNITLIIVEKGKFRREKSIKLQKIKKIKRKIGGENRKPLIAVLLILLLVLTTLLFYLMKDTIFEKIKRKNIVKKSDVEKISDTGVNGNISKKKVKKQEKKIKKETKTDSKKENNDEKP